MAPPTRFAGQVIRVARGLKRQLSNLTGRGCGSVLADGAVTSPALPCYHLLSVPCHSDGLATGAGGPRIPSRTAGMMAHRAGSSRHNRPSCRLEITVPGRYLEFVCGQVQVRLGNPAILHALRPTGRCADVAVPRYPVGHRVPGTPGWARRAGPPRASGQKP